MTWQMIHRVPFAFIFAVAFVFAREGSFAQTSGSQLSTSDIEMRTNAVKCSEFILSSLNAGITTEAFVDAENRIRLIDGGKLLAALAPEAFETNNLEKARLRIHQFRTVMDVAIRLRLFTWDRQIRDTLADFSADVEKLKDKNPGETEKRVMVNALSGVSIGSMPLKEQTVHFQRALKEREKYLSFQNDVSHVVWIISDLVRRLPVPSVEKEKVSVRESVALIDSHIMKPEVAANASRWIASNVVYSADELLPCCCEMGSVTNDNPWEAAAALRARCNTIAAVVSMPCSMNATNCQALTSFRNDVLSQIKPMADKETPAKSNTPESHRARGEAFYQQMLRQVASELQILIRKFGDIAEVSSGTFL